LDPSYYTLKSSSKNIEIMLCDLNVYSLTQWFSAILPTGNYQNFGMRVHTCM